MRNKTVLVAVLLLVFVGTALGSDDVMLPIDPTAIQASGYQATPEPRVPANVADGNLETRWSVQLDPNALEKPAWLAIPVAPGTQLASFSAAFYLGDDGKRMTFFVYTYDDTCPLPEDIENFTGSFAGNFRSSGATTDLQRFHFEKGPRPAQCVVFYGFGVTTTTGRVWVSLTEVELHGIPPVSPPHAEKIKTCRASLFPSVEQIHVSDLTDGSVIVTEQGNISGTVSDLFSISGSIPHFDVCLTNPDGSIQVLGDGLPSYGGFLVFFGSLQNTQQNFTEFCENTTVTVQESNDINDAPCAGAVILSTQGHWSPREVYVVPSE